MALSVVLCDHVNLKGNVHLRRRSILLKCGQNETIGDQLPLLHTIFAKI